MALTTQGHFMINDDIQEYVAKSLKVNYKNEDNLLVLSNIQDKDGKELTVFVSKWE